MPPAMSVTRCPSCDHEIVGCASSKYIMVVEAGFVRGIIAGVGMG
ncbi:hypothetical protein FRC0485_01506 [Corynebacterium diphtheriae]|nr:hypothetical protein FRC0485_01506 [Corynebacterium diphtheriae]